MYYYTKMLYITKAGSPELIITGKEKVTISPVYYLLVFESEMSQERKAFLVTDTSTAPNRYQLFTFTEGSTSAKTLAIGTHYWSLYAQTSSSNTNYLLANEEIDRGLAYVSTSHTPFNDHDVNTTIKQHNVG
jgi:hypothetical protein